MDKLRPYLVHALNLDDPNRIIEFCEWYQVNCAEEVQISKQDYFEYRSDNQVSQRRTGRN